LLSNEVIAKICCRLISATKASRFVEADEEVIEELRNTIDNKKHIKLFGLLDQHFPTMGKDKRKTRILGENQSKLKLLLKRVFKPGISRLRRKML